MYPFQTSAASGKRCSRASATYKAPCGHRFSASAVIDEDGNCDVILKVDDCPTGGLLCGAISARLRGRDFRKLLRLTAQKFDSLVGRYEGLCDECADYAVTTIGRALKACLPNKAPLPAAGTGGSGGLAGGAVNPSPA